ncbi:hypothetical protein DPMN_183496 [Dreissena polymorpha]|uniref:Uncharacterized protein n=1 Tax=Dreissena polymorpha TaxID=45954 RepID=A0A9D4I722_DREPO|nr:hypothetical protein DPMN_183496 [Dreissena polymorpha]
MNLDHLGARDDAMLIVAGTRALEEGKCESVGEMQTLRCKNVQIPCSHFHEDKNKNVTTKVLTRNKKFMIKDCTRNSGPSTSRRLKNAPPPFGHVFQQTGIIFKLVQHLIGMNLLTKKMPSPWQPCFSSKHIIENKLLTKFREDLTINMASNVLKRLMLTPHDAKRTTDKRRSQKLIMTTRLPPLTGITFVLAQRIIETNLLTKFHEDRTINEDYRVLNCECSRGNIYDQALKKLSQNF